MHRTKLDKHAQDIVDKVVRDITHTPDGYLWWVKLPGKGRHSREVLQRRWRGYIAQLLADDDFLTSALHAALTPQGKVDDRGKMLCTWLLNTIYYSPKEMLDAWLTQHTPTSTDQRKVG
jgi:hypothetical protein